MAFVIRFFLHFLLCLPVIVFANDDTIIVAGAVWPGFVNADGSGKYLEPVKKAFSATSQIRWDITEFERARRLFLSGRADILVGVYRSTYPDKLYPSKPLDIENELRAFFLPERQTIATLADLDDKLLGWHRGYEFDKQLPHFSHHVDYDDSRHGFMLLSTGKLDVILDYSHNVPAELASSLGSIEVLPKETLWLVFHNTAKGQRLLQQYETVNK